MVGEHCVHLSSTIINVVLLLFPLTGWTAGQADSPFLDHLKVSCRLKHTVPEPFSYTSLNQDRSLLNHKSSLSLKSSRTGFGCPVCVQVAPYSRGDLSSGRVFDLKAMVPSHSQGCTSLPLSEVQEQLRRWTAQSWLGHWGQEGDLVTAGLWLGQPGAQSLQLRGSREGTDFRRTELSGWQVEIQV